MMIAFVSLACSSPHTSALPLCIFISHLLPQDSFTLLFSSSHLIRHFFPAPSFFPSLLSLSLFSHCELSRNSSSDGDNHPNGWLCQNKLRQTFSLNKKKPQLEQQHLSDIFQASGCANNKIGVVCVFGTFHCFAPVCAVVVRAKVPTGYSCPVGRHEKEYLQIIWRCQLTKSRKLLVLRFFLSAESLQSVFCINPMPRYQT